VDVALIGVPYKSPYAVSYASEGEGKAAESWSPEAASESIRRHSRIYAHSLRNYDFEFDGTFSPAARCGSWIAGTGPCSRIEMRITWRRPLPRFAESSRKARSRSCWEATTGPPYTLLAIGAS
jgi:hypothetical protein